MKDRAWLIFLAALVLLLPAAGCGGDRPEESGESGEQAAEIDPDELEQLRALGYAGVAEPLAEDQETGVILHDPERVAPGLNLFTNAGMCSTQLVDMEGQVLHSWSYEPCFRWGNALLLPDGDLVVMGRRPYDRSDPDAALAARFLMRLSWEGEIEWQRDMTSHHDVALAPGGSLFTLTYRHELLPSVHPEIPVRSHFLAEVSPEGELLEEVSFLDLLRDAPEILEVHMVEPRDFDGLTEVDLFHSNSVEWIDLPHLAERHPIYGPNKILVCLRNQDSVAVIDWKTRRLVWAWGRGEIVGPHDATVLPNGNILIFDNGLGRKWSRAVEMDPLTGRIVWEHGGPGEGAFYTRTRGSNQRLSNGNTLLVQSDDGQAFEVTPEGERVWEFVNFNLSEKREPSVIVRMRRYEGLSFDELALAAREGRLRLRD
jgi:hypothetical protein